MQLRDERSPNTSSPVGGERSGRSLPEFYRKMLFIVTPLMFGFGWQIRGSGASDPSVAILYLLTAIVLLFPNRRFTFPLLGFAVFVFRMSRRGWGTFVTQSGIPFIYNGIINIPDRSPVPVPWWQGYFWLFVVGFAWGLPFVMITVGYALSEKRYSVKDIVYIGLTAALGILPSRFISELLIPVIAPEGYSLYTQNIYIRNYNSMMDNLTMSFSFMISLLYVYFRKKDKKFVVNSLIAAAIFGVGLSAASFWFPIGINNPGLNLPFWSLWEYFSGLFIAAIFLPFYSAVYGKRTTDPPTVSEADTGTSGAARFFGDYVMGHLFLFVYGITSSLTGMFNLVTGESIPEDLIGPVVYPIVLAADLSVYFGLIKRDGLKVIPGNYENLPVEYKMAIILMFLMPVHYIIFLIGMAAHGLTPLVLSISAVHMNLDTFSFIISEIFLIILYRKITAPPPVSRAP